MFRERISTILWFAGVLMFCIGMKSMYQNNADYLSINCSAVYSEKAELDAKNKKLAEKRALNKPSFNPDTYLQNFKEVDYDPFAPSQLDKNVDVCKRGIDYQATNFAIFSLLSLWAFAYLISGFFFLPPILKKRLGK